MNRAQLIGTKRCNPLSQPLTLAVGEKRRSAEIVRQTALEELNPTMLDQVVHVLKDVAGRHEAPHAADLDDEAGVAVGLLFALPAPSALQLDPDAAETDEVSPDAPEERLLSGKVHVPSPLLDPEFISAILPRTTRPRLGGFVYLCSDGVLNGSVFASRGTEKRFVWRYFWRADEEEVPASEKARASDRQGSRGDRHDRPTPKELDLDGRILGECRALLTRTATSAGIQLDQGDGWTHE